MVLSVQASSSGDPRNIPQVYALTGPLLFFSAFLPFVPDGRSFWSWAIGLTGEVGWTAVPWVLGASTPFLLGLFMSLASAGAYTNQRSLSLRAQQGVGATVCVMIGHAIVFSAQLWWSDIGVASGEFLAVCVIAGLTLAVKHGKERASQASAESLNWLADQAKAFARWGCLVIAAGSAWARLQVVAGHKFGWGIEVLLLGSALSVWALASTTQDPARKPSPPAT